MRNVKKYLDAKFHLDAIALCMLNWPTRIILID